MEKTHTIVRSFCLNKKSLDEQLKKTETGDSWEERYNRVSLVTKNLQKKINEKGYILFSGTKNYMGLPQTLLVIDNKSNRKYDKRLENEFLESAKALNLPYEPEDRFIDWSRIRQ